MLLYHSWQFEQFLPVTPLVFFVPRPVTIFELSTIQGRCDHFSIGALGEAELIVDPEKSGVDGRVSYSEETL